MSRMFFNITDLLMFMDPRYRGRRERRAGDRDEINFLEAIFRRAGGGGYGAPTYVVSHSLLHHIIVPIR